MSEDENFVARWARRKRDAAKHSERTAEATERAQRDTANTTSRGTELTERTEAGSPAAADAQVPQLDHSVPEVPAFDLSKLPSLDSITVATDIRAFLQPGVPPELARAALRRAWAADPGIRDFVGLADYDWDFNRAGAITGFAPLEMTDELRRLASDMVGRSLNPEEDKPKVASVSEAAALPPSIEPSGDLASGATGAPIPGAAREGEAAQDKSVKSDVENVGCDDPKRAEQEFIAAQQRAEKNEDPQPIVARSHGRALTK